MLKTENKEKLIRDFVKMAEFEEWAGGFYLQVSSDSRIRDEEIKEAFRSIAGDEKNHAKIVKKIINIVKNNL